GGTLDLEFAAGVDPIAQIGRTFDVFDWTGVNPGGTFDVQSPYAWDLSQLYTSGEVTLVSAVPEPSALVLAALGALFLRRGLRSRPKRRAQAAGGWLASWLVPHRHRTGTELSLAHEL